MEIRDLRVYSESGLESYVLDSSNIPAPLLRIVCLHTAMPPHHQAAEYCSEKIACMKYLRLTLLGWE